MSVEDKSELSRYTPEEMFELYQRDPKHFDELAEEAIRKACIGRTPEQSTRFRQMQWTIDAQLRKAKTPSGRMQAMESIFYGKVFGSDGELAHLMESCTDLIRTVRGNQPQGEQSLGEPPPAGEPSGTRRGGGGLRLVKR